MIAVVKEDFSTWTTWTRWAHTPEIVICWNTNDPVIRKTCNLFPHIRSFVICVINCHQQAVFWDVEFFGQQFPSERNGLRFEVIAKAKVTKHFKERVVTCGVAHVVQIVVLAASTYAFLRGCCAVIVAGFDACEQVFELHHARVYEHQRWVVARHQRARRDDLVSLFFKIVQEGRADII